MSNIQHTYGFTATYEDGTTIEHDPNGSYDSKHIEGKTLFTDVLEKDKESKLVSFVVHNDELSFGVDLRDGHFELNGVPFWQHRPDLDGYKDFRVIYFNTTQRVISPTTGQEINAGVVAYTIGWQVTHDGQNVQKTLTFGA